MKRESVAWRFYSQFDLVIETTLLERVVSVFSSFFEEVENLENNFDCAEY
jgi:hypothetical protein